MLTLNTRNTLLAQIDDHFAAMRHDPQVEGQFEDDIAFQQALVLAEFAINAGVGGVQLCEFTEAVFRDRRDTLRMMPRLMLESNYSAIASSCWDVRRFLSDDFGLN